MRASDFDFHLPDERIAQAPAPVRDQARLYFLPRRGGEARHAVVAELADLLPDGALLVMNDTRVIPARLLGRKPSGGRVELLLLHPIAAEEDASPRKTKRVAGATPFKMGQEPLVAATGWRETWTCLGGASKPIRPGLVVTLEGEYPPVAEVVATRGAEVDVRFHGHQPGGLHAVLQRIGRVPLPPYIARELPSEEDRERYQTVYARVPGAAAAPTAGLHFTPELLAALDARGFARATVTLHVGLGTFAPLRSDDLDAMTELHAERYEVPTATALAVERARAEGRPVVAVGTTTVRTLESAADEMGRVRAGAGETRIFIRPGHGFRVVDALITNFHLPRSTLLMLVAAFAGRERILTAYADAVARGYRFYSYGDAMLIV